MSDNIGADDLFRKASASGVSRINGQQDADPLRAALADKRTILASKVLESTINTQEAEAISAENTRSKP